MALEIVYAVKATQRIPENLRGKITFYSAFDVWHYIGVYGPNQCFHCADFDGKDYFGPEIRFLFSDHTIMDEDHIAVNYHVTLWGKETCKCELRRVGTPIEPELVQIIEEMENE